MKHPTKPVQHGKLILLRRNMLDDMFWNKQKPPWFFSSFLKLYEFCNCASHSNISSNMLKTWCWMKCWTGLLWPLVSKVWTVFALVSFCFIYTNIALIIVILKRALDTTLYLCFRHYKCKFFCLTKQYFLKKSDSCEVRKTKPHEKINIRRKYLNMEGNFVAAYQLCLNSVNN